MKKGMNYYDVYETVVEKSSLKMVYKLLNTATLLKSLITIYKIVIFSISRHL